MRRLGLWLIALAAAAPAAAQTIVTSPRPDSVDVTVYRDPNRSPDRPPDLRWLNGYALVSETRTVTLPAGQSELRFEGVAAGMIPQSAIVTGFPDGIVERNRDAYLLSPATLLDRSLGRRVTIRRTSRATGETTETEAVIRTGSGGAVVLQTAEGFEALRCTGMPETLVYDSVPAGLSARPTLSVLVRSSQPLTATVILSYLASGFDWQANYVAQLSPDGSRVDLFAWLTLASNDETSFVDADTMAVAGRLNREAVEVQPPEGGPLQLRCWPQGRTSDIPLEGWQGVPPAPPPSPMVQDEEFELSGAANVIVTGSRIARREDLGDLKLYRIPEPVTVAANSQKQVALLEQPHVRVELVYRQRLGPADDDEQSEPSRRILVTRNRTAEGLGLPLPAGRLVLFASAGDRPILIGEGTIRDLAVGEDVEVELGPAEGVRTRIERLDEEEDEEGERDRYRLTVTNDRSEPVRFEAELDAGEDQRFRPGRRLPTRDGRPLWAVTVPANGSATLRYGIEEVDED